MLGRFVVVLSPVGLARRQGHTSRPTRRAHRACALALTAWVAASRHDARAGDALTVDEAMRLALASNADLGAARAALRESEARIVQAGLWPNPEIELDGRFDSPFRNEGESGFSASVNQPFSVSGRIGARVGAARVDLERARAEVAGRERDVVAGVRRTFNAILALDRQLELQRFLIALGRDLLTVTRAGVASGQLSVKDSNAIEIQLGQGEQRVALAETERRTRAIELSRLLGREPAPTLAVGGALRFEPLADAERYAIDPAVARRPDFRLAKLDVALAQAERAVAEAERLDDWRLGLSYEREHSVVDGAPPQGSDGFLGLRLSVPLPVFDHQQGRIAEAEAAQRRAEATQAALRIQIQAELADALSRVRTLGALLERYPPDVLARGETNIELAETGYRQGLVGIAEVIQSRQQFADLKSTYIDVLRDYGQALVDLDIAAGITLPTGATGGAAEVPAP